MKGMYGLPQAGRVAYEGLMEHLKPYGYAPTRHTPGLWKHETRPTTFTLIVDKFAVKYMSKDDANHLLEALRTKYEIDEDWEGNLYSGMSIQWDFIATVTTFYSIPLIIFIFFSQKYLLVGMTFGTVKGEV